MKPIHIQAEPTKTELTLCGKDIDIDLDGDVHPLTWAAWRAEGRNGLIGYCVECAAKLDAAWRDYDPTPADEEAWSGGIAESH
jgi:hypothetical protein